MANLIYTDRLLTLYSPYHGIGMDRCPTREEVESCPEVSEFVPDGDRPDDLKWELGRVRHFLNRLQAGEMLDPIMLDDPCPGGWFSGYPVVTDGHHRLIAAAVFKAPRILCEFGGLVSTLNYLQGRRKTFASAQ